MERQFRRFVQEDIGHGDVTTLYTVPAGTVAEAEIVSKQIGVIAGVEEALAFLEVFNLNGKALVKDGSKVLRTTKIILVKGDVSTLLSIERTLLNLLSRMSGIATATSRLVEKIHSAGYKIKVAATRKTGPGLSYFDKKAVMVGGGDAHRAGLDDMILIKDNHIAVSGGVKQAIESVLGKVSFSKKIEIEVQNEDDALVAAKAGVDILMLDNFTPKQVEKTIALLGSSNLRDKVLVEASGGITEQNVIEYAAAGVDIVSLGEITQSSKALDLSLEITQVKKTQL
jgi:nicotinate-nucleotide pyrophosphorylase (carboxylating)